jgi:uncharacterized cupin superfamily protein
MTRDPRIIEEGTFPTSDFAEELEAAPTNHALGTTLWLENERTRVWEVRLEPGERGPFHAHATNYFWTVVDAGRGLQRKGDGTYVVRDYRVGDTLYLQNSPQSPMIHDLENVGDTLLRFVTVEILDV